MGNWTVKKVPITADSEEVEEHEGRIQGQGSVLLDDCPFKSQTKQGRWLELSAPTTPELKPVSLMRKIVNCSSGWNQLRFLSVRSMSTPCENGAIEEQGRINDDLRGQERTASPRFCICA